MIPEGRYRARPVAAALGLTGSGKEQIAVSFDLLDPKAEGARLTWYGFFTDDTAERTIESLRHCGWTGDDLTEFVAGAPPPPGFDKEVEVQVEHNTWEDKKTARIAWVNSGGGLVLKKALSQQEASSFAQRMKGRINAFDRMQRGSRPPAQSKPKDDVPF